MPKMVPFEGVFFNADWAVTKTEKEFIKHESHHDLTAEQLKEAYALCKAAVKAPVETSGSPAPETT